ncbi:MAG: large conductance mechanosensitive channel protein [Hyphomonadaceae bacterium]|nr:MAG: large conductance mechanosensitive channel protein [Hyphomonadaceae bacterium]KAF0183916.1 MAG: large conductance mechanosensitive channel protein [Hyphomonadaceae bacterium]
MSITSEFKEFIMRGNFVDLAVGVVIGAAFGKIVDSFVKDVIMPIAGYFMGGSDFSAMKLVLKAADEATKTAEVAITYGNFINTLISFLIIGFSVFMVVKAINKIQKPAEAAPAGPTTEGLLGEIRDLLAKK